MVGLSALDAVADLADWSEPGRAEFPHMDCPQGTPADQGLRRSEVYLRLSTAARRGTLRHGLQSERAALAVVVSTLNLVVWRCRDCFSAPRG